PWCATRPPFVYSFVQSHSWDVEFGRDWAWERSHRIGVAMPMLAHVELLSAVIIYAALQTAFVSF
ncbi:hypothetical protein BDV93DRAFT_402918, partial [Ceratobasidium sp. AG-I]